MINFHWANCSVISHGFALQIRITCWAIVSLAGGRLGKVEVEECQGEKEKSPLSHPQERNLGWTIIMKVRKHAGAILIGSTSRTRFWILGKSWLAVDIFVSKSATPAQSPNLSLSLLRVKSPNGRLFFVAYFHSHLVSLSKSIFLQLFVLLLKWM